MKFPVFKALGASFAYLITHAGTVLRTLWLPVLAMTAANFYVMPGYIEKAMALSGVEDSNDPSVVFELMGPMFASLGLLYLVLAIFWPMSIAGNLRHLVRGESPRLPFYFQFGMDEVRVLLSYILLIIMLALVYLVGILGFLVLSFVAAMLGSVGGVVIAIAALVMFGVFFWFILRLSVTLPAAINARKIGVAESWRVTKGAALPLFVYFLVWSLIFIALGVAFVLIATPALLPMIADAIAQAKDPSAGAEIERRIMEMQLEMFDPTGPRFYLIAAATYVYTIISTAVMNVSTGVAYRYLAGGER